MHMSNPSTSSDQATFFVSTQTAALLTGKTIRTIHNWLESGSIAGRSVHVDHLPGGQIVQIDVASLAKHIPVALTDAFLDSLKSAEGGDAQETTNVGTYFYQSAATQKIAVHWFELAAKRGDADAMAWLWDSYYHGYGVEADFATALQWLGKAAKQGSRLAQALVEGLRGIDAQLRAQSGRA